VGERIVVEWYFVAAGAGAALAVAYTLSSWLNRFWHRLGYATSVSAHFSPRGGCANAIVAELHKARREILVQAYSFSCPDIAKALAQAAKRGVRVKILLDRSNEKESYSEMADLKEPGIELLIDAKHAIAHNKIMLIDRWTLLTGSFNFTRQADHENAENLLIIKGHGELVDRYYRNFMAHHDHCQAPGTLSVGAAPQPQDHHAHGRAA
jgi:phosphatidylserine/phosphatidylglycerophosphate/cardiolipin synthase-like enzyme